MKDERTMDQPGPTDPIGWRAIVYGTPVCAAGGAQVGVVREVLGSDAEDIFHGLRVELDAEKRDVMVLANDVGTITTSRIETDLDAAALAALPPYQETETYHLASVGWLRKHLGWRKDSEGDEEPG